jgi:hypothetical protein
MVPESKPEQASYPERSAKVAVAPDGGHYLLEAR